ncbi:hypothetical protein PR048_004061 [Dryococelus australis]|uniref:Uncharacterized protein n=1 Tax=Dryococelus australis TaxID=614101 RepID=A0ABQ9I6D3_9NEOP|nr:hypothetical protein PR048_004061 [Dryococelus australis]
MEMEPTHPLFVVEESPNRGIREMREYIPTLANIGASRQRRAACRSTRVPAPIEKNVIFGQLPVASSNTSARHSFKASAAWGHQRQRAARGQRRIGTQYEGVDVCVNISLSALDISVDLVGQGMVFTYCRVSWEMRAVWERSLSLCARVLGMSRENSRKWCSMTSLTYRCAVAQWLGRSPPTTAIRVPSLPGSLPDFRMWESCWTITIAGGFLSGYSRFSRPCIPAPLHPKVSFHVMSGDDGHLRVSAGNPVTRRGLLLPGLRRPASPLVTCTLDSQSSAYWSLSCVFIGCFPAPGSYGIRKVFTCKSAIGSDAYGAGLINCDPITKAEKFQSKEWGRGCLAARALASHHGEPGSIPGFSHVGIVADDAARQRAF